MSINSRRALIGPLLVVALTSVIAMSIATKDALAQYGTPPAPDFGGFDPAMFGFGQVPFDNEPNMPRRARPARLKSATQKNARQTGGKNAPSPAANSKKAAGDLSRTTDGSAAKPGSPGSGISFRQEVAPILVANCIGCHTAGRPGLDKGKLELTSFAKLMRGTPKEKVIEPGKPDESHLLLRIKGEEEPRMPQGGNSSGLSQEAIAKVEQWIKAGARLDSGIDPQAALASYAFTPDQVRRNAIARMSPKEREDRIEKTGRDRWKKTNPKLTPEISSSLHFVLFHNLPKDRASNLVKTMEIQLTQLKRALGGPATEWAEKVSLYVFNSHNDFVEFVRTIENREIDASVVASGQLSIPQPYVTAVDPQAGKKDEPAMPRRRVRTRKAEETVPGSTADRTLAGLLTERLGEATVLSNGKSPRWLAAGLGAFLASRLEPKSAHYQKLRELALEKYKQGWEVKATDVLGEGEQVSSLETRGVGFAVVEALISSADLRGSFPAFAQGMSKGAEKLDDVLTETYNATREQFLARTGDWVAGRYGTNE
jgi:hypothetical protein